MEKTSKIYIAGHRGMVGSSILRALKAKGYSNFLTKICNIMAAIFGMLLLNGYHLSVTKFIDSSPNFQLNYHQKCLFVVYLIITKLNDKSPI
jgi:hypothetical protein